MARPWRDRLRGLFARVPAAPATAPVFQPSAWLVSAAALLGSGRGDESHAQATARLAIRQDDVDALAVLGAAERRRGQTAAARQHLEQALAVSHAHAYAHAELAAALLDAGDVEAASDHGGLARVFSAPEPAAAVAVALSLMEARLAARQRDDTGALARLEAAGPAVQDDPEWCFERARLLSRLERPAEAVAAYGRVLDQVPAHAAAWANRGLVHLNQLGDPARALEDFRRAAALEPTLVAAQGNVALALAELGRADEALAHLDGLVSAHPGTAEYRWNRAVLRLARGEYAAGWDDYEARHQRTQGAAPRRFPLPEWEGQALVGGQALLVYGEQGVGDEIMFASCVPDAQARAGAVVLECEARLAPLFARSFPGVHVHGAPRDGDRGWLAAHPALARQSAIGALPRLLRREAAAFPAPAGYLRADPARVAHWRAWLAVAGPGTTVGIAWRGGTVKSRAALRAMPLADWAPAFQVSGARWVVLQQDAGAEELAALQSLTGAAPLVPAIPASDLDELAALVSALDRVITVDNTLAHLAGALGKPVWIVLPQAADWRWGRSGARSVWYPAARLWRQAAAGDWSAVAKALAQALQSGPA
jgi:tetratricopeptide (TPR) repeat protein